MTKYVYCGLVLESEIKLPELETAEPHRTVDMSIRRGGVPLSLTNDVQRGPNWAVGNTEGYWWLEPIVRFQISAETIRADVAPDADPGLVRALLLEGPIVMAMIFRGEFCLRAAAVSDGRQVKGISGLAAGGKSTSAAYQVTRGHYLVSDNLLRITISGDGELLAWPQGSGVLLWPRSIALLNIEKRPSHSVRKNLSLERVILPSCTDPLPLKSLDILKLHSRAPLQLPQGGTQSENLRSFGSFAILTAGRLWVDPAGRTPDHFAWCLALVRGCPVKEATAIIQPHRPDHPSELDTALN